MFSGLALCTVQSGSICSKGHELRHLRRQAAIEVHR